MPSELLCLLLRGRGCPRSIFTFSLFLIKDNVSYQELFTGWKNIIPSLSYHILKSQKYIQLDCAHELKSRFPKNYLQNLSSPTVNEMESWYLVVLCSRTQYKTFIQSDCWFMPQKWKCRILNMPTLPKIIKNEEFEISIFSLLRPKSKIWFIESFVLIPRT